MTIDEIRFLANVCWFVAGAMIVYGVLFPDK